MRLPLAQLRMETACEMVMSFEVITVASVEFGDVTGRLDEILDLFARDQDFPQDFATGQLPPVQEAADGLGAAI